MSLEQLEGQIKLKWAQAFEAKNGRAPGRRERSEQKDVVCRALRSKIDPVTKTFDVSIELKAKELFVWATSRTVIEEVPSPSRCASR